MQFFKIDIQYKSTGEVHVEAPLPKGIKNTLADRDFGSKISKQCEKYSDQIADKGYFFLSTFSRNDGVFGMVIRGKLNVEKYVGDFVKTGGLDHEDIKLKEITLYDFSQLLRDAERNDYIYDDQEILREYELEDLVGRRAGGYGFTYDEIILRTKGKDAIYLSSRNYFTEETFKPELDRIFTENAGKKAYGHPVDYMIESDDERTLKGVKQLLIQALYDVGRITNRRYCEIDIEPDMDFYKKPTELLYKTCIGGAVVINICSDDNDESDIAHGDYSFVEDLCKIIRKYSRGVLTIICMPRECKNIRMSIFEHTGNCTFVEIKEKQADAHEAIDYLKRLAHDYSIRTDKKLLSSIEKDHMYLVPELNEIFDEWYNVKLKTTIFSQYKDINSAKKEISNKKPKGSAYDELESMIGLASAKRVINQALDCYKAQKVFKDKGMQENTICNHMIFTGNPGTAKTTVARLFARILMENDVLSRGHIIEVGRSDLVGKYVGWTAPTIKRKFRDAKGGILFIDEAYSLVDDHDGSYGDEAINTIVQEMENHRDDVIVIFAGYPDKMEGFLDKNPGLRSRIAHYVHFEDYDSEELCKIACLIASKKGLELEEGALAKIRTIVDDARMSPDFGNGRFVRNLIEKAGMAQSSRLLHMEYDKVTREDIRLIRGEDIDVSLYSHSHNKQIIHIGFSA